MEEKKNCQKYIDKIKNGQKNILISGISGIGKTKFVRLIGTELLENKALEENLRYIYFLQVGSKTQKTKTTFKQFIIYNLADRLEVPQKIFLENEKSDLEDSLKNQNETYAKIINKLSELNSPKMLILDDVNQDWLREFVQNAADFENWTIIATIENGKIADTVGFDNFVLKNLESNSAYQLFTKFYTKSLNITDQKFIENIITSLDGHALTIKILASILNKDWSLKLSEINSQIDQKINTLASFDDKKISSDYTEHQEQKAQKILEYAFNLAKLDEFSDKQKNILRHFSLFPSQFLSIIKYQEMNKFEQIVYFEEIQSESKIIWEMPIEPEDMENLTNYAFLEEDNDFGFKMHKIMQLAIQGELEPNIENCLNLIKGLNNYFDLRKPENTDFTKLFEYVELGASILEYFEIYSDQKLFYLDQELACLCHKIGKLFDYKGEYSKAEELYKVAIKINLEKYYNSYYKSYNWKKILIELMSCKHNLASTYRKLEKFEQAEEEILEVIKFQENKDGKDINYAILITTLANIHLLSVINKKNVEFKVKKAHELYLEAIKINSNNVEAYEGLIRMYQLSPQKENEVLEWTKKILEISDKNNPNYSTTLHNIGMTYWTLFGHNISANKNKKYLNLAQQFFRDALDILNAKFSENHPNTLATKEYLELVLKKLQ